MAVTDTTERRFEEDIESSLLSEGGYSKGTQIGFDKKLGLNVQTLVAYLQETQSVKWNKYTNIYSEAGVVAQLGKRVNQEIEKYGVLYVLRKGISDRGVHFQLFGFKPETTLNTDVLRQYAANKMEVIRQFAFEEEHHYTIDMVLSVNGIPVVALELKNQLTGQSVVHGKKQFMKRDPKEKCFQFNQRFLAYFAVDLYEAWMTTKLAKDTTYFLPFNQGSNGPGEVGGAGNPPNGDGYASSYLWEKVLAKDSLLDILQRFLHLKGTVRKGTLIFPRYHQWDLVHKLLHEAKTKGAGDNFLIQHSTGSGKSYSLTWLAYRLSTLHDAFDKAVYDSVIVVTDRRVLDKQLQEDIMSFDHTDGVVETIDHKKRSKDLRDAINDGKRIIITTLQKFPVIYEEVENTKGKRFAIIVDEAHSSQTGSSAQKLRTALADKEEALREFAAIEEREEEDILDGEDYILKEMLTHGQHSNLSFFAFTATPKRQTLEMFGKRQPDGSYRPFHIYSMRQAIEEGFILDVLKNYMTYETSYRIAKKTEENPDIPVTQGLRAIRRFESLHPYNLRQKTIIMVEHFREHAAHLLNGEAKAMVVTSSRLHAVRYYYEFKEYIQEMGYDDLDILVAFSGTVRMEDTDYTEANMNKTKSGRPIGESQTVEEFDSDDFNMLIVAEKYQTGFNQPKLNTMYIDKKLKGPKAVQTLSRANRTYPGKNDTFILDFVNNAEDIKDAYAPYFEVTELAEAVDINMIYDIRKQIHDLRLYTQADIERFLSIYYKAGKQTKTDMGKMTSLFKPILERYQELTEDEQYQFRVGLRKFNKWYSYITQIVRLFDEGLQKEYIFSQYLSRFLPQVDTGTVNLDDILQLEYYSLKETFKGDLSLKPIDAEHVLEKNGSYGLSNKPEEENESLENIIKAINELYIGKISEEDKILIRTLANAATGDNKRLEQSAKQNTFQMFMSNGFEDYFEQTTMAKYDESIVEHDRTMEAFEKILNDKTLYRAIMQAVAKEAYVKYQTV